MRPSRNGGMAVVLGSVKGVVALQPMPAGGRLHAVVSPTISCRLSYDIVFPHPAVQGHFRVQME